MQAIKKVERPKTIGGSDAIRIMEGDWHSLWLEKTGRQQPKNLDDVLPVQIGILTEELNIKTFVQETGFKLATQHDLNFKDDFRHATLDGMIETADKMCVLECKHTNANNTLENVIRKYMPQLQHYMQVAMMDSAYLSVIFGNGNRYEWCQVQLDNEYIKMLYEMEATFWKEHIEKDIPPEDIQAEIIQQNHMNNIKVNDMIRIDMDTNNEFVANAHTWRETKIPYDQHRAVGKVLKELIPANCRLAEGGGIKISRTKAGHLTIKENKGG
ncbi:Phage-related protein, predicted endonuclease (COG5377) [uncultured Mediterranean phage uvMED]|nr:Phage-related protein, predicted endonuclease (COG5377) [uncultured Mediterranean phage uvMED]